MLKRLIVFSLIILSSCLVFALNKDGSGDEGDEHFGIHDENSVMLMIYDSLKNGFPDEFARFQIGVEGANIHADSQGKLSNSSVWALKFEIEKLDGDELQIQLNRHFMKKVKVHDDLMSVVFTSKKEGHYSEEVVEVDLRNRKIISLAVFKAPKQKKLYYRTPKSSVTDNKKVAEQRGVLADMKAGDVFDWFLNRIVHHHNNVKRGDVFDQIEVDQVEFDHAYLVPSSIDGKMHLRSVAFRMHYRPKDATLSVRNSPHLGMQKYDRFKTSVEIKGNVGILSVYKSTADEIMEKKPSTKVHIHLITGDILRFENWMLKEPLVLEKNDCNNGFLGGM